MRKHRSESPRPSALRRITKREGMVAHYIERPAARRARLIMAMRAACKRAAAPGARGFYHGVGFFAIHFSRFLN